MNMADSMAQASLETLPIELIYRICDLLDPSTILLSLGYVCHRLRDIVQTYQNYQLNFQSISRRYFYSICPRIDPTKIVSLTLSDDQQTPDQIKQFLSLFQLEDFVRLRSLTLIQINEEDFQQISSSVLSLSSLTLKFSLKDFDDYRTMRSIHSMISQQTLRQLTLSISLFWIDELVWPETSFVHSLTMLCRISIEQFSTILSQSPYLTHFTLQDCTVKDLGEARSLCTDQLSTYPQLKSLIFEDCTMNMDECELILSLTPSLEQLQILTGTDLNNGYRWENFIRKRLLYLRKFQFAISGDIDLFLLDSSMDVETLISSFRTPFWLEIKQWFVICYYFKDSASYSLYSLPICKSTVRFHPQKNKIFATTHPQFSPTARMTDQINEMQLNLTSLMINYDENSQCPYPYFENLQKLSLCVDDQWPLNSTALLSMFINLSSLLDLTIDIDLGSSSASDQLKDLIYLFQLTVNVRSLTLETPLTTPEHICALVPDYVRHLQVSVDRLDDTKVIVERLKSLFSVTFDIHQEFQSLSSEYLIWLKETRGSTSHRLQSRCLSIWFN